MKRGNNTTPWFSINSCFISCSRKSRCYVSPVGGASASCPGLPGGDIIKGAGQTFFFPLELSCRLQTLVERPLLFKTQHPVMSQRALSPSPRLLPHAHLTEFGEELLHCDVQQDVGQLRAESRGQRSEVMGGRAELCRRRRRRSLTCLLSSGCCRPSKSRRTPSYWASSPRQRTTTSAHTHTRQRLLVTKHSG